jgi:hypothetical protein
MKSSIGRIPIGPKPRSIGTDEKLPFERWLARVHRVNHSRRRIDSRFLLPARDWLPHVNCYPAAEGLRGGGEDDEATEYGDAPRT